MEKEQEQNTSNSITDNSTTSTTSPTDSTSQNIIDKIILTDDEFENIDAISNLESESGSETESNSNSTQFFFQTIRNDYQHEEPNHISLFTEELDMDTEYKSNQDGTKDGTKDGAKTTTETRNTSAFAKLGIMDSNRSESESGPNTRMEPHIDTESIIQVVEFPRELGTPEIVVEFPRELQVPVELRTTISQNTTFSGNNNTQSYRLRRTGKTSSRTYTAESREPMQGSIQGQKVRNTKDMEECGRNCCWCTMWIPALFRPRTWSTEWNPRS